MTSTRARKRRDILWPIALAVTVTWCSGNAAVDLGMWEYSPDKIAHFAVYGALATAILRNEGFKRWPRAAGWLALLLASGYGLGDEYRQRLSHIRHFDWFDWVADTLGAVVAVSLYVWWPRYRTLLEMPVGRKRAKPRVEIPPEPVPASESVGRN